jgi:hypothetical protein
VCNGNDKDLENYLELAEQRSVVLRVCVAEKLNSLWSSQLEPLERDAHAGKWAPGGDDLELFYRDA